MSTRIRSGGTALVRSSASNGASSKSIPSSSSSSSTALPLVREKRLQKVLQSMEARLPHSVRELAAEVHLSPAHLQRLFKQETGVHISDLLCERRLALAASLLSTTDMEIKEVAYFVGYGHHSSFVRAFQRRFRQSPKRYRQNCAA